MSKRILLACIFILSTAITAQAVVNGTVKGNGCCYDDLGRYCGKGGGGATGSVCECGLFSPIGPHPGRDGNCGPGSLSGAVCVPTLSTPWELFLVGIIILLAMKALYSRRILRSQMYP